MKLGASAQHLAVVDKLFGWQRILDVPGHHDRPVMLDMLGQWRLAHSFDCFAQAGHAYPRGKRRAEADLVDKVERCALTADPPMADAAKVMVAMALERLERRRGGRDAPAAGSSQQRR